MEGVAVLLAAVAGGLGGAVAGPLADRVGLSRYGPGTDGHDPDDADLAPLTTPTTTGQRAVLAGIGAAAMAGLASRLPTGDVVALFGALLLAYLTAMVVDLQWLRLPNTFTYPAALVAVGGTLALSARHDVATTGIWVGGLFYPGVLLVMRVAYQLLRGKEGMGLGDIKLAVSLGASAGWLGTAIAASTGELTDFTWLGGLTLAIYAALAGNVLGAVGGGIALRRVDREMPFGPALVAGWLAVVLLAESIVG